MGKMIENPRYRVMSFRVSDAEYKLITDANPCCHIGTFLRDLTLSKLQPAPLPPLADAASGNHAGLSE